jgi:hypothetical protein
MEPLVTPLLCLPTSVLKHDDNRDRDQPIELFTLQRCPYFLLQGEPSYDSQPLCVQPTQGMANFGEPIGTTAHSVTRSEHICGPVAPLLSPALAAGCIYFS